MASQKRVASGILCSYGYFRQCQTELDKHIPMDIATVCAYFVDIYLKWLFSIDGLPDTIIVENHKIHKTEKISLVNNRWNNLTSFEKRLLMDILLLNNDHFITEIECSSQTFDIEGIKWLQIFLLNTSHPLQYINLSNCNLNNESVQMITQSLQQNECIQNTLWLDLSNNKEIDDISTEILIPLLPKLHSLHLNDTNISDKSLEYFKNYEKEKKNKHHILINLKNENVDTLKWETSVLQNGIFVMVSSNDDIKQNDGDKISMDIEWNGIWKSQYGPHGDEYQYIYKGINRNGDQYLIARKITGDINVPSGKITWFTDKIPIIKDELAKDELDALSLFILLREDVRFKDDRKVKGSIGLRNSADIDNPDGFYWDDCKIAAFNKDILIRIWHRASLIVRVV